jgi:hypothetical protein
VTTAAKSARKSRKNASKPVETTPAEVWYKVLVNGKSCHGGSLEWSLPKDNGDGTHTPGAWHEVEGRLSLCNNGLHVTNKPAKWWATGATAYLCEVGEERTEAETDKIAVRRCRLLKPLSKLEMFSVQVFLEGEAKVSEGAAIAFGSATVRASGSATVRAYGSATVEAYDSATVRAYDSATVNSVYGTPKVTPSENAVHIDRTRGKPIITTADGTMGVQS